MKTVGLKANYEKLEILGDSILDYVVNYSLIKYTLLGKGTPLAERKEIFESMYVTEEGF
jgi:dsRNA-specific ribonuclease